MSSIAVVLVAALCEAAGVPAQEADGLRVNQEGPLAVYKGKT